MRDYDKIPLKNLIRAKHYRRAMTQAEKALWYKLRSEQLGTKFRRQHAIGKYIVDFVSLEHMLVIEVDGPTHASDEQREYDARRTESLQALGFRVVRFPNGAILKSIESVLNSIILEFNRA